MTGPETNAFESFSCYNDRQPFSHSRSHHSRQMELLIAHRASVVKLRLLQLNIVGGQGVSLQMDMVIFEKFFHRLGSFTKDNTFYCRAGRDPMHLPQLRLQDF